MKKRGIVLFLMFVSFCISVAQQGFVLVDNAGRKVEFTKTIERAVVANRYNSELIRACGAIDKVVATDMGTAQDRKYWNNFAIEDVIGKDAKNLNYEKIIELNPEVVILPQNGSYQEAEEKLLPFGIKVFVISGYDTADFGKQVKNIGKIFGTEEKAEEFYNYFNSKLEYIKNNVPENKKKTLYLETVSTLSTTVPGDYFYNMTVYAGAKNIFEKDFKNIKKSEVDPEVIVSKNPDVIIKLVTPKVAMSGTGVYNAPTRAEFLAKYNEIKNRPSWQEIKAIKNDSVYFMSQFGHGGASKLVGTMFVAKWLYPELLPDLNPYEVYSTWLKKYQGIEITDGHFYDIKELLNE
ncbi:ABC transporter substrate-binding protein [Fusobacterium sp.]|uniref:ABC transporter substrate-binding protein n=1 Tax=Fusobacterium sp. TaxID=68766 RepID=UPI0025C2B597|nr:ABC transporter substrate-binding protein [Fusobacterium sp.]